MSNKIILKLKNGTEIEKKGCCCTHFYYDVFLSTFDKIIYNTICFLQYLK